DYLSLLLLTAPSTPEIYTLSLHHALPISAARAGRTSRARTARRAAAASVAHGARVATRSARCAANTRAAACTAANACPGRACRADRKSTRLNSSHLGISYAVFCLKKKNTQ